MNFVTNQSAEQPTINIENPENYWVYLPILRGENINLEIGAINRDNWQHHYDSILNILRDAIETDEVQHAFISIKFNDGITLDLSVMDYLLNLIMWSMLIKTAVPIQSYHVFFDEEIKKDSIKDYIDKFLINESRKKYSNKELNNIIDDALYHFHDIDEFSLYLSNTVNLEDNVELMNKNPEFYECMHADLSQVPLEDVKSVGMSYANKAIDLMKHSKQYLGYDHCLADACRAGEGINPKQFKEFTINIGTKPDGRGGVFEKPILHSFINGGVDNPVDYFIESSTGRTAQIIKYNNVGSSGHFARLLGLNNMDSHLCHDSHYDCGSTNFIQLTIKDKKMLKMLVNRYYRTNPNGIENCIKRTDTHLIGQTIYLRSPITCASAARGQGICYKCYGDLAYTVYDADINFGVNIGRVASETLSSSLTQKLLSAKHLLETFIEKITWSPEFYKYFELEGNIIRTNGDIEDSDLKDLKIIINPDNIALVDEEDDDLSYDDDDEKGTPLYNEYITEFDVLNEANGEVSHICNDKNAKLYISSEFNTEIRRKAEAIDTSVAISFNDIKDITLFIMPIENNELSKTLDYLNDLLNKKSTIEKFNIHDLLQNIIGAVIDGGLNIASTHLEVILSNQCRDASNILEKAKWYLHSPDYQILTLDQALTSNPSVTVSLSYQKVKRMLYNPLTFKKNGSSFMDLFFMEQPQYAIKGIEKDENKEPEHKPGDVIEPMIFFENPNGITTTDSEDDDSDEG